MTTNDLLNLYRLEKSTSDFYEDWRAGAAFIWFAIVSIPKLFDLPCLKYYSFALWIVTILTLIAIFFFHFQHHQASKRMDQIMKMLLVKNP
ncbi:hypothetical protein ACLS0F_06990 [Avibacterium endocarditidis]|uniref:Hemophilus-specific protein n=1 Tax=Avibacterium endocarditidis TaxID=380674 RepID=A0ABX4ZQ33_9PAST|nr:hypothetical protein [Avibacterium endocarditidis]POY41609.1 hypothetical protein C3Z13_11135 [Avibacterium endocarditidis]